MSNKQSQAAEQLAPAEKLRAAYTSWCKERASKAAALRNQHPDWSEEKIRRAVREDSPCARS